MAIDGIIHGRCRAGAIQVIGEFNEKKKLVMRRCSGTLPERFSGISKLTSNSPRRKYSCYNSTVWNLMREGVRSVTRATRDFLRVGGNRERKSEPR